MNKLIDIKPKLAELIKTAKKDMEIPIHIEKMLVDICFEMYKKGVDDGHRICIKTLEVSKETIIGKDVVAENG